MDDTVIATHLNNLDHRLENVEQILLQSIEPRLERVEQILPTLATKEELRAAIEPLATKEELRAAIAPLATKEELRREVQEEGERSRRYMKMLIEHQDTKIELLAEHLLSSKREPSKE